MDGGDIEGRVGELDVAVFEDFPGGNRYLSRALWNNNREIAKMRSITISIFLVVLFAGCAPGMDPETEAMTKAMLTYLPEGFDSFTVHEEMEAPSWLVMAQYSDTSVEELAASVAAIASNKGWEEGDISTENKKTYFMDYERSHEYLSYTVVDIRPHLEFMVSVGYHSIDWLPEKDPEFVAGSMSPDARTVLEKLLDTYKSVDTYADLGTHVSVHGGEVLSELTFLTKYRKNGDIHFEYEANLGASFTSWASVTKLDGKVSTRSSYGEPSVKDNISLGIASLYGVSSRTSGNIPEILTGDADATLFSLANLEVIKDATLEDGTSCARLQGNDLYRHRTTIWIEKERNLIRLIERFNNEENHETTTYEPSVNVELSSEDFESKR